MLMRIIDLLLPSVDRATLQPPRIYLVSSTTPPPPPAFNYSPEPGSRLHTPCWPVAEFGSAATSCYGKSGLCGWPVTSGGADHTARQCPTARQLGARQQCASGDKVKRALFLISHLFEGVVSAVRIAKLALVSVLPLASISMSHRSVQQKRKDMWSSWVQRLLKEPLRLKMKRGFPDTPVLIEGCGKNVLISLSRGCNWVELLSAHR